MSCIKVANMKLKKLSQLLIATWASSLSAGSALAASLDAKAATLSEVNVTATRSEQAVDSVSKSVSIITREQIVARNPRNVQELLEEIPGVSLSRAGGLDGQIVMRGSNSNDPRTVLFIDGDRFRGRNTLEYTLLDPNQIERIEVVRGPASSLYGSDAVAGIVNIITRRARGDINGPFKLTPRLAGLSANSVNNMIGGRVELEGTGNGVDMLLGLNARRAGDYESPQGTIPNSDFRTLSADLRLGYTVNADHRFELIAKQAEVETGRAGGIGGAPGAPLLRLREDPIRESLIKLGYQGKNPGLGFTQTEASLYARKLYTHISVENRTTANRLVQSDNFVDGPLIIGGKLLGVRPWGNNLLTVGTDFFHEDRKGTEQASTITNFNTAGGVSSVTTSPRRQNAPDAKQTNIGLFLHNDWEPAPQWTVSSGVRTDYIRTQSDTSPVPHPSLQAAYNNANSKTETPLTGSLGVIYRPWQTLHFTANVGKAFRAPATFESFGSSRQGAGFLVPNPALESEEALVYEVGTRLRLPKVTANLTVFENDFSNLIVTRPIVFLGTNSTQRQNVGEARIRGVEFDAVWKFADRWQTSMNASYLRGTDTTANRPLPYIPPLNGLLALRYSVPAGFYIEGVSKWALSKTRINTTQERETAGFAVLNLYAGFDLWKLSADLPKMRLIVGVENVFDKTYRQPTTVENIRFARSNTNPLLEPGRAFSISLNSVF
jgi:hemoglobin/transferrin/lactoferrin receptor protein